MVQSQAHPQQALGKPQCSATKAPAGRGSHGPGWHSDEMHPRGTSGIVGTTRTNQHGLGTCVTKRTVSFNEQKRWDKDTYAHTYIYLNGAHRAEGAKSRSPAHPTERRAGWIGLVDYCGVQTEGESYWCSPDGQSPNLNKRRKM